MEAAGSGGDEDVACSVAVLDEDVACSVAVLFLSSFVFLGFSKPAARSNADATPAMKDQGGLSRLSARCSGRYLIDGERACQ